MTSDTTPAKRPTPAEKYTEAVTQAASTAYSDALTSYGRAVQQAATVAYVQMIGDAYSEAIAEAMKPSNEAFTAMMVDIVVALKRRRSR